MIYELESFTTMYAFILVHKNILKMFVVLVSEGINKRKRFGGFRKLQACFSGVGSGLRPVLRALSVPFFGNCFGCV